MGSDRQTEMPGKPRLTARRLFVLPLTLLVQAYRYLVSPLLGTNCRFAPSCSEYAIEALERHGAIKGGYLAAHRILRCHPWGGSGFDPVPPLQAQSCGCGHHVSTDLHSNRAV